MFYHHSKRVAASWFLLFVTILLYAQAPQSYYSAAKGKSGKSLKTAMFEIVGPHKALSYDALWSAFETTDVREDGTIWDMYSNVTKYRPSDHGGNYSGEGDCFNREHSFPKSWFNDAKPMYTDLFHLYPTDGYVNGRRSNCPFGENKGERWTSKNGFSKLGNCTVPGYSGIVFEPADEYKGDFARTYFYMATAYEDRIASWSFDMSGHDSYRAYADWAMTMLLRWASDDPVSEKEIKRNNEVYKLQNNRNPYIDFPGLEQYVWGSRTSEKFDPDNYGGGGDNPGTDPEPGEVAVPQFSPASGVVEKGTLVTISTTTEGASVYYTVNGGDLQISYMSATVPVNADCTISAYAMMGDSRSQTATAEYIVAGDVPQGQQVFTRVESAADLQAGMQVLIVCEKQNLALSATSENQKYRTGSGVAIAADKTVKTEVDGAGQPRMLTLGGTARQWSLYDNVDKCYLGILANKNQLDVVPSISDNSLWDIAINSDGTADLSNVAYPDRTIRYNPSSPRFSTYEQGQNAVSLYGMMSQSAISNIPVNAAGEVEVYDLQGKLLRCAKTGVEALQNLPSGLYIINGHKMIVK